MISVLILTKNEELDLPGCLKSVEWSDDVHVLDSYSTDQTVDIATNLGAKITQRIFDGYASQRNAGLALPFKYPWLLILDADERIPANLAREIGLFINRSPPNISACRMRRRDIFDGRWLKHAQISPFFIRLVRVGHAIYEREINEVIRISGEVHDLSEHFDHYPFSKGISHWIAKHNTYSSMEADLIVGSNAKVPIELRSALFHSDFNQRRQAQKALFYRMPMRPVVKLIYMLFWRRAIFDGWPGIRYSCLQSIYEYFIVLKTKEKVAELDLSASRSQDE